MGLYYLQSRYYDPELCRFLNADIFVSTGQGELGNNMFAYCLNDPINRIDISGSASIWYYLLVDHDMGFIHRLVQAHIVLSYQVQTEVRLSSYGRADVLHQGAVWEIKHAGKFPEARAAIARIQASNYVLQNDEVTHLGAAGTFSGMFYIQCVDSAYVVEYNTPYAGVILYTVTEVSNYEGSYFSVYVPVAERKKLQQNATVPATAVIGGALGGALIAGYIMTAAHDLSDFEYAFG